VSSEENSQKKDISCFLMYAMGIPFFCPICGCNGNLSLSKFLMGLENLELGIGAAFFSKEKEFLVFIFLVTCVRWGPASS